MARRPQPITRVELAGGRIRYRTVADFGETGGTRKQVRRTFDTRREAVDWLAEVRTGRKAGTLVAPDRQIVAQVLDTWLIGRRDLKPSTRHGYENALKPVRERLGAIPAQQLTKRQVEELVEHMLTTGGFKGTGRAPGTVRHSLIAFEQAMDDAERQGQIARNVVRLVKKPRQVRHEMKTWTAEQLAAFLDVARDDRFAALWRVAAFGLRRSEVAGLRWCDIDFENSTARRRHPRRHRRPHGRGRRTEDCQRQANHPARPADRRCALASAQAAGARAARGR